MIHQSLFLVLTVTSVLAQIPRFGRCPDYPVVQDFNLSGVCNFSNRKNTTFIVVSTFGMFFFKFL